MALMNNMNMNMNEATAIREDDTSLHDSSHLQALSEQQRRQSEQIAQKENQNVSRLRVVMLIALVCSAIAVSLSIYFYLDLLEKEEFQEQFQSDAQKLLDSIGKTLDDTLGATDAFCFKMVSSARAQNIQWPFFTLPHFAIHAMKVLKLSKALSLNTKLLVYEDQKEDWETFVTEHDDWIQESLDVQEKMPDWRLPIIRDFEVSNKIVGLNGPLDKPFPYSYNNSFLTSWQSAPFISGPANLVPYNRDMWSVPDTITENGLAVREKKATIKGTFWGIVLNASDPVEAYITKATADWGGMHLPEQETWRKEEPKFTMYYPIIDAVDTVTIDITNTSQPVVGVATFGYFFYHFLEGMLPPKTTGVRIVVENECGPQVFTYQIDGEEAVFLGPTDVHDAQYDDMVHTASIGELVSSSTTNQNRTATTSTQTD